MGSAGFWVGGTFFFLAVTLLLEWREVGWWRGIPKAFASTCFIFIALALGAFQTPYGWGILIALLLSWWGDVLLVSRAKAPFLIGLVAFLLAHFGYGAAFVVHGVKPLWCVGGLAGISPVVVLVAWWVLPKVPKDMKVAVVAYMAVITAMVTLSFGAYGGGVSRLAVAGACLFYVSDMLVARDRFIKPGFDNHIIGLPLYYGAQVLLALSVGY